jgi:hypothetical protein
MRGHAYRVRFHITPKPFPSLRISPADTFPRLGGRRRRADFHAFFAAYRSRSPRILTSLPGTAPNSFFANSRMYSTFLNFSTISVWCAIAL